MPEGTEAWCGPRVGTSRLQGLQFHLSERIRGRTPEGQVCAVLGDLSPRAGLMAIGRQPSPPLQGRKIVDIRGRARQDIQDLLLSVEGATVHAGLWRRLG